MSDLGKNHATTKDPSTTDSGPLLNLFMFCNHFKIQQSSLSAVKDWRNKWAHAPDHTLTDKEKKDAFADIEQLITDPELACMKEIKDCHQAIEKIETTNMLILPSEELKIFQEYQHIQEYHKKEIEETFWVFAKWDKLIILNQVISLLLTLLLFTSSPLLRNVPGMLLSLMAFFMFSQVGDKSVIPNYGKMS